MSDYIDKSSLYKSIADREEEYRSALLKEKNYNTPSAWQLQGLLNATTFIKHFVFDYPTVDVGPVVRCKYCECLEPSLNSDWSWCCYFDSKVRSKVRSDDFCSHGKRREDE